MNQAIHIEQIGKRYFISHRLRPRYTALRDVLAEKARSAASRLLHPWSGGAAVVNDGRREAFWALRELFLDITPGERVGIIGHNGAGKSTLLKILSRVTEPTTGRIVMDGRIASLLEIGTGFHPELTGRENIYLNGAILGMTRREIHRKFDEIVAFAETERFLDTPVKHYSSGMYVRLAFAVAAHLEPEILLVDEVLAVGDTQFQKKCLGKMGEATKDGRTVLFVSHNMTAVRNLCERTVLLKNGRVEQDGPSASVIAHYLETARDIDLPRLGERTDRTGDGRLRFLKVDVRTDFDIAKTGAACTFILHYRVDPSSRPLSNVAFSFSINTLDGAHALVFFTEETESNIKRIDRDGSIRCTVSALPLAGGTYALNLYATVNGHIADYVVGASHFHVDDSDYYADGASRHPAHPVYVADHSWRTGIP